MKRPKLARVLFVSALALACSESVGGMLEDAGQLMMDAGDAMTPDAGAQSQTFPLDCSESGFVLTDVDQKELGKVIVHQTFPDPWGTTDPPQMVEAQFDAWWSIGGKVLVQCNGGVTRASIEVLP